MNITELFNTPVTINENVIQIPSSHIEDNQAQTNEAFSQKWTDYETTSEKEKLYEFQKKWYLDLYGFENNNSLGSFLQGKKVILDAGCGLGYKAAWFAESAPESIVFGMDMSDAVDIAANNYRHLKNLFFVKGDIGKTDFKNGAITYVSCDQVLQHTEVPHETFRELTRILAKGGEFSCYVYRKKALPRELLDEHFRTKCKTLSHEELQGLSEQLTELGKTLHELNIKITVPDIPVLGIKGGAQDLQRFIYWNFLKCFWNEELGLETSVATNYDWYSPSNAMRFSEEEYKGMIQQNNLRIIYWHEEAACYSGRFLK